MKKSVDTSSHTANNGTTEEVAEKDQIDSRKVSSSSSQDDANSEVLDGYSSEDILERLLYRSDSATSMLLMDIPKLLFSDFDWGFGADAVTDGTRKRFNDMKKRTKRTLQKLREDSKKAENIELHKLNENFIRNISKFDARLHANLQSSTTEKLFYAIAVFLVAVTGFIVGKYPDWFHVYHTILFCILMPIRFYTYFKLSFQYYLADLCYYVNLLLMVFIWWAPNSKSLFLSVFSLAMGSLSFAVITWRNSLVLHLIEKTTSSFIHIMPPVTLFVMVHELPNDYTIKRFPAVASIENWNFVNGILCTSAYYTAWQVLYHYFITIKRHDLIKKGRVTSFTYLKQKKKDKGIGKFVNSLPYSWMQITAFTLIQFGYQILTMIFCPIWFRYKHLCGSFVVFIFIWASYNGATFYIDVFGRRLEKEVDRLKTEILELQEKQNQSELTNGKSQSQTYSI